MFRAVGACLVWVASAVSLGSTSELYYEGNIIICELFFQDKTSSIQFHTVTQHHNFQICCLLKFYE
jgi:hypothetical protein